MTPQDDRNALKHIRYISLPQDFDRTIEGFRIDPEIPLPVEIPQGSPEWSTRDLSWEMIVAAILKILAYDTENANAEYYRNFVRAVKPRIVDELTETAVLKARNHDFDIAEEIFLALAGLLPNDANMRMNLALVYEQKADAYDTIERPELAEHYRGLAFETYKQTLSMDTSSPEIHLNAGYFYLKQRSYDKAVEHLSYYAEHSDNEERVSEVRNILAEIASRNLLDTLFKEAYDYIRMGREEEGIAKVKEFLAASGDVWNAWFLLGWGHRRRGEYREAKEAFLKALELGAAGTDPLNELAICLMELGELDQARKRLHEALSIEPENVKIISNLGVLALKENNPEEARGFFETVREIEPNDPIAEKYLKILKKA
jgi:Flp pilus assembly protein TadD